MSHPTQPPPAPGAYPPPGWQQQPLKKRRKWPWIVGGIVALLVVVGIANGGQSSPTPAAAGLAPTPAPTAGNLAAAPTANDSDSSGGGSVVVYEVLGKGSANNVTYMKENFSQEQQTSAKMPWRKELQFKEKVGIISPLSLVAQNGASGGEITCRITVDGEVVGESTSSGKYAVVTCNGNS